MENPAMKRRNFIYLAGGGVVIAAGGALAAPHFDAMPEEAIAGWKGPPAGEQDPRRRAIAWAILAPNPHNMQPWLVDLRQPDEITLYVDRTRLLPHTDPFGRQVMIGQGTFLELLVLALAVEGYRAEVVMFPEGEFPANSIDARPVARIGLIRDPAIRPDPLFQQISRRRSTKTEYAARAVEAEHLTALMASHQQASDLLLAFATGKDQLDALRTIATQGSEMEMQTPRTHKESIDRLRIGASEIRAHRDGISLSGPMIWALRQIGTLTPEKALTPGTTAWESGRDYVLKGYANAVAFGWIASPGNGRAAQVAAGRAYVRLNLKATELGVAMHPHSQTLQEFPEMAQLHRAIHDATGVPEGHKLQMFFRLGYAPVPGPTPRRPPHSIVVS
jgi:hypothetical protein